MDREVHQIARASSLQIRQAIECSCPGIGSAVCGAIAGDAAAGHISRSELCRILNHLAAHRDEIANPAGYLVASVKELYGRAGRKLFPLQRTA